MNKDTVTIYLGLHRIIPYLSTQETTYLLDYRVIILVPVTFCIFESMYVVCIE